MANILIIDDSEGFRNALERNLQGRPDAESEHWNITCASSAAEALAIVQGRFDNGNPIEIVLTDLWMPDANAGIQVLEGVKAIDKTVMTILFSERLNDVDREKVYQLDAYAIVNRSELGARISDELYYLTRAALIVRANQQRAGLMHRFADRDVANALARNPNGLPLTLQCVTIVSWDIRGFSALSAALASKPTIVSDFIERFFALARETMEKHNGILDKFIGDGVMAIFGHPLKGPTREDGAIDAALAALYFNCKFDALVTKNMGTFRRNAARHFEVPRLGCGMNTDEVLVGYVGQERGEFTAYGDGVNLAARVQDEARTARILVTQTTHERLLSLPGWEKEYALTPYNDNKPVRFKNITGEYVLHTVEQPQAHAAPPV